MYFFDFIKLIENTSSIVSYLQEKNVLKRSLRCVKCNYSMSPQKYEDSIDGCTFRCTKCKARKSIRTGSFIESLRLPLEIIASIIYLLGIETLFKHIAEILKIDKKTVIDFASIMREEKGKYLIENGEMLGGPGVRVQVMCI